MRTVSIFKNGNNRAIRLPRDLDFEGVSELEIVREGDSIILRPVRPTWGSFAQHTPVRTIYSDNGGTQWQLASSSTKASNSGSNIMAFSSTDDFSRPLAVETATATLSVHPVVQSLKTLALTDDQPYEGLATLSLVYL